MSERDDTYRHENMYQKEMGQQAKSGDYTLHFTVEKRIEMFVEDLEAQINPVILEPRFYRLISDIKKEAVKKETETDIARMKLEQSWYSIEERIWRHRETIDVQRRFDFDALIHDIRKAAAMHPNDYLPTFIITPKKDSMRTEEELKKEIDELKSVRLGVSTEIEVMNSKNRNAQIKRDRVTSQIEGLYWALNEKNDDRQDQNDVE